MSARSLANRSVFFLALVRTKNGTFLSSRSASGVHCGIIEVVDGVVDVEVTAELEETVELSAAGSG